MSTLDATSLPVAELGQRLGANPGHLNVALRLFESLGWVDLDPGGRIVVTASRKQERLIPDGLWTLVDVDFDAYLRAGSGGLLDPWLQSVRDRWNTGNPLIADLLDGMLVVPVLTLMAKRGLTRDVAGDLRKLPPGVRNEVISLLKILGWLDDSADTYRLSAPGAFMFERAMNLGLAESYRPMLRSMDQLLFGDAESCFFPQADGNEGHVNRSMNVISSGVQHDRYFAEVDEILISIFNREPLSAQPRYVADMGSGDGTFLKRVFTTVRDSTLRGRSLALHPLTLIGIDLNKAALEETSRTLEEIDHIVISGDIGDPMQLVEDLRNAGVDPGDVLHIRSFLDHDRPYKEPADQASLTARRTGRYLGAYADRKGGAIPAATVVQSLVEHLQRWAQIVNAHGLILLEVHCQDPRVVRTHIDQSESLYFDALQGFSHQLLVEADAALMAAAEAGLFARPEYFRKFPQHLPQSRITLNLFERQSYRVRLATVADMPALLRLEEACWPEGMRMPAGELERRIVTYALGQWVLEFEDSVVGAIYSQRIAHLDQLRNIKFTQLAGLHDERGSVIQLLALNVLPEMQHLGLGYQLLDLILMRSALQGGVAQVAGITRCKDFRGNSGEELAAYVRESDTSGRPIDPILNFHYSHGANLLGLVEQFRPEDTANLGAGVLLTYDLVAPGTMARAAGDEERGAAARSDTANIGARLETCLRRMLGRKHQTEFSWTLPLRDMGLDSLDLLGLRTLLQQTFEQPLSPTFFFAHPTLRDIHRFYDRPEPEAEPARSPAGEPPALHPDTDPVLPSSSATGQSAGGAGAGESARPPIAIVGMACRFPGCDDLDAYWQLLARGGNAVTDVPAQRWNADQYFSLDRDMPGTIVSRQGGFLQRVDEFDASFFNIAPREARLMDPQQRLLLELHWESLERAGIDPTRLRETACGIFVGLSSHDYELLQVQTGADEDVDAHYATGSSAAIAAGRLAYFLGTRGPALTLDTACSSSLVAVHQAIRSLRSGECNLALASGVNLMLSPRLSIAYSRAGMLSPHGRCKAFDAGADGYVRAEGCGVIVMKRLDEARRDGDIILAVIRGSDVNQDGASNGLTAPNLTSQQQLVRDALKDAGLQPAEVDYIEAHGTGTSLGDPVEFHALHAVFGSDPARTEPLWLGSVKTNIGHAEAAAGVAGLIKVVLSLQQRWLPAHLHFETPNPHIDLRSIPARIPVNGQHWQADRPLRAGVNSFGFSGTNAHVIVEQAPALPGFQSPPSDRSMHVLALSAKSEPALQALIRRYADWMTAHPELNLGDLCYTAGAGRAHHDHRVAVTARTRDEAARSLRDSADRVAMSQRVGRPPNIAFLFTGQGSQYPGMARELWRREPVFRAVLRECSEILHSDLGKPLEDILYPNTALNSVLDDTANTQPALFAVEYALARMLQSWGVQPSAVMGHSVGEYVAACIAGVFTLEDGLRLIAARGRLMSALPRDGAMLAVLGHSDAAALALAREPADISIAAYNGPNHIVVSGRRDAIDRLERSLAAERVNSVRLQVSHAFHSPLLEPMLPAFAEVARQVGFSAPKIDLVSNVTGELASGEIKTADYWCRHIRQPVRFEQGIHTLSGSGARIMLEIGPHPVLCGMGRKCVNTSESEKPQWLHTLAQGVSDWDGIVRTIGALYESGSNIEWSRFDAAFQRRRLDVPTYPWQRQRYWFGKSGAPSTSADARVGPAAQAASIASFGQSAADMLFNLVWQPYSSPAHALCKPAPDYIPALAELREDLRLDSSVRLANSTVNATATVAEFDELAVDYVTRAFGALGWIATVGSLVTTDELVKRLGIQERHARLVARMLDILAEAGILERVGAGWKAKRRFPAEGFSGQSMHKPAQSSDHAVERRLFERCASRLAEVLTGRCDPLNLLFPDESQESAARLYDDSHMSREPNALMKRLVAAVAASVPANRVLRVLELGAGTGGTTGHLLPLLDGVPCEYVFSDVSKLFLQLAEEKYRKYSSLQFALLDIEQPPAAQGIASGGFDVIIAANVLHATRDMQTTLQHVRALLAPGGMLALIEGVRPARWIDLVFGQTDGWWRFSDLELRPAHPLLSPAKWERVLRASGFAEVATLPTQSDDHPNLFEQAIVIAKTAVPAHIEPSHGISPAGAEAGTWLIFGDDSALCAALTSRLESAGNHVARIIAGAAFGPGAAPDGDAANVRRVNPSDARGIAEAAASLLASARLPCRHAVCLWGASLAATDGIAAEYELTISSCTHALHAAQALVRSEMPRGPKLWFATRGAQSAGAVSPDPRSAVIWGLGRALAVEHPETFGGLIDLQIGGTTTADVDAILCQVATPGGIDQCAFRNGVRFVPRLVNAPAADEASLEWPADGCHIVTGGLSGVGLHIARWMAEQGARRVVLMSRRRIPPRAEWDQLAPHDALFEVVSRIREIESFGAVVKTVAVDIADAGALSQSLESLGAEAWLPVHGVVHAATGTEDRMIPSLDRDSIEGSFRAKVLGVLNVEACLADAPLRFFVCCSSVSSLLTQEGQATYAAANAFLDAFVSRRRTAGLPALGVNWGGWYGAGAAVTAGGRRIIQSLEQFGLMGFLPEAGVAALNVLLRRNAVQAAVVRLDWDTFRIAYPAANMPPLLRGLAATAPLTTQAAPASTPNRKHSEGDLRGQILALAPGNARAALLKRHLREILAEILELDNAALDPSMTLGSLGLDSLMGVELKNRCERSLGLRLSATMVWNYPTITDLTRYLSERLEHENPHIPQPHDAEVVMEAPSISEDAATDFSDVRGLSEEAALQSLMDASG